MFKKTFTTVSVVLISLASSVVHAAETTSLVPQGAKEAISGAGDTAKEMFDLAWPVIALVFGGMLAIKIFKRVGSKV